jgi:hypothetical protein
VSVWPPKGLARPAQRALAGAAIGSLAELAARREADIARLHGMGARGLAVLRAALAAEGLSFRQP